MNKVYLCIDLKTFYASVECVERRLDPFKTDLIVADARRGKGSICLAISPKMKERGIKNRCRVFEIPSNVHPIIAKPRMKKYMEYSTKIYKVYLKYVDKCDIHVYSIDEAFLDVTSYLKMYQMTAEELAKTIMKDIFDVTGITSAAGIGTNLYLAKIALDITAKHSPCHIGYLDEEKYKKELWHHTPLTDFWQIGIGTLNRLHKLHLKDMYDIAHANEKILYKEFGINAKLLIDHSKGIEPCTIKDIKAYKPKTKSLSNHQILQKDYDDMQAKIVLTEMVDNLVLELSSKHLCTDVIGFYVGYSKDIIPGVKFTKKLNQSTCSYTIILNELIKEYDYRINPNYKIRKIGIWFGNVGEKKYEQLDLFHQYKIEEKDSKVEETMIFLKNKFGKNSILRGLSYMEGATQISRNKLIGGHNAE